MSLNLINSSILGNKSEKTKNTSSTNTNNLLSAGNPISSLSLKDNVITNKIKELAAPGNNPFGSNTKINKNSAPQGAFAKSYMANSGKLDINNDGFLSSRELVSKMQDRNIKGEDAALVGALIKNESKIRNLSNDEMTIEIKGITKNDILALDQLSGDNALKSNVDSEYYYQMGKVNGTHAKYSNTFDADNKLKLPLKASDVDYKDLHQGGAGDCYFLAALASLAKNNPQKIVDMIKDNKDGTYNVKFANKDVKINAPTDAELGLYAEGKAWVPIIEKAYAEYRNETIFLPKVNPYDKSGGGSMITGRGIKDLTGSDFDTDFLKTANQNTTRAKLKSAVANNKMMTSSVFKNPIGKNALGIPDGHVYSVLGYDDKTDKVKIRNPWGNAEALDKDGSARDGNDDGIFEVSMEEFHKTFSFVAYQK